MLGLIETDSKIVGMQLVFRYAVCHAKRSPKYRSIFAAVSQEICQGS
jgi:hypothetical protein